MESTESVTHWIRLLQAGDRDAVQQLWELYFQRLVKLARSKLQGLPRRAADEEDVALSAFDSFCRGAEAGRFTQLVDRNNLWPLLVVLTARKARAYVHHERRQKRGGGWVQGESALVGAGPTVDAPGLEQIIGREPTPEFAAQVAEECERLIDRLPDAELRRVAVWKMEGYSNEEIARELKCVPRTVERKLRVIRSIWGKGTAHG